MQTYLAVYLGMPVNVTENSSNKAHNSPREIFDGDSSGMLSVASNIVVSLGRLLLLLLLCRAYD